MTVVSLGLHMGAKDDLERSWKVDDGEARPELPTILNDGETMAMTWIDGELGCRVANGEVQIIGCFAQDGRGNQQLRTLPTPLEGSPEPAPCRPGRSWSRSP